MKKKDVQKLAPGLYRIYWKSGGRSLAAVGVTENGERWMAPTNWVSCGTSDQKFWRAAESVEAL